MKQKNFIKICGITNVDDAMACVDAGATAIGLNFYPGSKRYIEISAAAAIAEKVRGKIALVGVFVNETKNRVKEIAAELKLTYCQFSGDEEPEFVNSFGNSIKVFHVNDSTRSVNFSDYSSSMFLLDTFHKNEYGGTGKTFNWLLAREANEFGKIILAGGLTPDNVFDAIVTAQSWGVDVSSGVELSPGNKDHSKIQKFVAQATAAFAR